MIKVLFFASLAELAGRDTFELKHVEGLTVRSAVDSMVGVLPMELTDYLKHDISMVSVNKVMVAWDDTLCDGDELAFLPPFSGG